MRFTLLTGILVAALSGCNSPTSSTLPTVNGKWAGGGFSANPDTITNEDDSVIAVYSGADSCTLTLQEDNLGDVGGTAIVQFFNISVSGQDTTWHEFVNSTVSVNGRDSYPAFSFSTSVPYESIVIHLDYFGRFENGDLVKGALSDRFGNSVAMNLVRLR